MNYLKATQIAQNLSMDILEFHKKGRELLCTFQKPNEKDVIFIEMRPKAKHNYYVCFYEYTNWVPFDDIRDVEKYLEKELNKVDI